MERKECDHREFVDDPFDEAAFDETELVIPGENDDIQFW